MLNQLTQSLAAMRQHYSEESGKRSLLEEQRSILEEQLDKLSAKILIREQAILLLTKTAEVARGTLVRHIEETVTAPLQGIWGDDRYFKIKQYIHNKNTGEWGADFEVYKPIGGNDGKTGRETRENNGKTGRETRESSRNSNAVNNDFGGDTVHFVPVHPYSASGGGLADVVSAVLQMTLLEISKPRPGGPLCLDEPSKQLDNVKGESGEEDDNGSLAQKQEALAEFIRAYAESSGRQVLLSSHNATLIRKAHKIVKVEPVDAVTCRVVEE